MDVQTPVQLVWSSALFDCGKDEESCWWTTWCCCVVSGRTMEAFGVGNSKQHVVSFVLFIFGVIFLTVIGLFPIALIGLIVGLIYFDYQRTQSRTDIRQQLNIPGTFGGDCNIHACCACCAISQEAREAVATNKPLLDYCSGQPLSQLGGFTTEEDTTANAVALQSPDLAALYGSLSQTSQMLVKMWTCFAFLSLLVMAVTRPLNIVVLLLIFLQPALIMYFFYWRTRRAYASLDLVVKLFTVGFFMATTQSIFFESAMEAVLGIVAAIVFAFFVGGASDGGDGDSSSAQVSAMLGTLKDMPLARLTSPLTLLGALMAPADSEEGDESNDDGDQHAMMRRFFPLVILYCFVMAYVIAAGVEETMKHFAVRCCRMTAAGPAGVPRSASPHTVVVFLLVAALGFATAENMEYVFGVHSTGSALNAMVGELTVLLLRLLMPVHLICAVIQAANLSKVVMGVANMHLVNILLPAIVLHGTFDFVLFLLGAIESAFELESVALMAFSFILPVLITICGLAYAVRSYKEVERLYDSNWRPVQADEEQGTDTPSPLHTPLRPISDILPPTGSVIMGVIVSPPVGQPRPVPDTTAL